MSNQLHQAFARAEEESITLQILRERLADADRILNEALELNQREQHHIQVAIAVQKRVGGLAALHSLAPDAPTNTAVKASAQPEEYPAAA